jgi:acetyl esterase/lipase
LYRPVRGKGPWPLVVWVHGGGWIGGTRTQTYAHVQRQVELGRVAVASVDYRLAPEHRFPVPLQDVKRAVRYLKANAARLGLRADKVLVAGHSAGANLAMMVAVTPGAMEPTGLPKALARQDSTVQGVVSFAGPSDLVGFWKNSAWGKPLVQQYLHCTTLASCPLRRRRDASVATWLDRADPPAYLVYGDRDEIVPARTDGGPLYERWHQVRGDKVVYDLAEREGHVPWRLNMVTFETWMSHVLGVTFGPAPK